MKFLFSRLFRTFSLLLLILPVTLFAQEKKKEMQIRIVEDGKVIKDTSYTISENSDVQSALGMMELMLDKDAVFRHMPPRHRMMMHDMPDAERIEMEIDSVMKGKDFRAYKFDFDSNFTWAMKELEDMPPMPPMPMKVWVEEEDFGDGKKRKIIIHQPGPAPMHWENEDGKVIVISEDDSVHVHVAPAPRHAPGRVEKEIIIVGDGDGMEEKVIELEGEGSSYRYETHESPRVKIIKEGEGNEKDVEVIVIVKDKNDKTPAPHATEGKPTKSSGKNKKK